MKGRRTYLHAHDVSDVGVAVHRVKLVDLELESLLPHLEQGLQAFDVLLQRFQHDRGDVVGDGSFRTVRQMGLVKIIKTDT